MTDKEFYNTKNIELFMPDGIEFLGSLLVYTETNPRNTSESRDYGLQILSKLLNKDLIEVFHWGKLQDEYKDKNFTNNEIIEAVKKEWYLGADFPDFYLMPMFKYKDWYLNALEQRGLTSTTFFKTFVEEEIGDIGAFIEEHRPK